MIQLASLKIIGLFYIEVMGIQILTKELLLILASGDHVRGCEKSSRMALLTWNTYFDTTTLELGVPLVNSNKWRKVVEYSEEGKVPEVWEYEIHFDEWSPSLKIVSAIRCTIVTFL